MTISEFSRDAVCRYLRSVVFIDDKLFSTQHLSVENETLLIDGQPDLGINGGTASLDSDSGMEIPGGVAQGGGVVRFNNKSQEDALAITDGFAKEGIICGVYKPMFFPEKDFENEGSFTTLLNVCKNADVFILDWQLFKENDKAVAQLLSHILTEDKSSSVPNPVRFCAIYTNSIVDTVCVKIFEALQRIVPETKRQGLKLSAGGMTVCIYARGDNSPGPIAAEDLAGKIISDFAKTYEGILPSLALRGIASIRENTKRILDKFPREMDSALLVHAGLTLEDPSVVEDVLVLLTDEVKSVLHDMAGFGNDVYALLIEALKKTDEAVFASLAENADLVKPGVAAIQIKQYIVKSFASGGFVSDSPFTEQAYDCVSHKADKKLLSELQNVVVSAVGDVGRYKPGALSKLFCLRTVYSDKRVLKPGTIIRDTRTGAYHICLMPLCDSLRLGDEKIFFPFWKLSKADDHEIGKAHGVVVDDEAGNIACLCLKGKIRNRMTLWRFKAENVVAFTKEGSKYVISESPKEQPTQGGTAQPPSKFEWVAELKPFHAQRMAEYVSREFSRVGLTESEWLRQQVDR